MATLAQDVGGNVGTIFYLIVFLIVAVRIIRQVMGRDKEQERAEEESERGAATPGTRPSGPGAPSSGGARDEVQDFLEGLSRRPGAPSPRAPRPVAERPAPPRPVSRPAPRPVGTPRPVRGAPVSERTLRPPPPPREEVIVLKPSARITTAPIPAARIAPAPPLEIMPEMHAAAYIRDERAAVVRAETEARLEAILPAAPLQRALVLTELLGHCRARRHYSLTRR